GGCVFSLKTVLLYQQDSYLREFEARVEEASGGRVVLDRTAFHPGPHGGLDTDTGYIFYGDKRYRVVRAAVEGDVVAHYLDSDTATLDPGAVVKGVIDWERRYRMMRLHTFSHILAAVLYEKHGVLVTGGHITSDYGKDDFSIEGGGWREVIEEAFREANEIASRCIEVKVYWLPREEALKIPGIVKLANKLPPEVEALRIVEIPGVDVQADGGPHVRNTCEIGRVVITKLESKGKRRKRVYYTLEEALEPAPEAP
ncbi:misacylated tRNAala hydrolase AlaX, partial [Aeropyrum pernix]